VFVADTDPQASLSAWWESRAKEDVAAITGAALRDLPATVRALADDADLLLIDTPPSLSPAVERVVFLSDFVLLPCRPSPHDLRAVAGTLSLLGGKPFGFVVTQAVQSSSLVPQVMGALSEHGCVAPVVIGSRVGYAASMIDGRTAGELDPRGKAAKETSALWAWVSGKVGMA